MILHQLVKNIAQYNTIEVFGARLTYKMDFTSKIHFTLPIYVQVQHID